MKFAQDVIIEPVVSEKSYDLVEELNTYTFVVHPSATKTEIRAAVAELFDVRVLSVNTMNRQGKRKRTGWVWGTRPDTKRALVTLATGDSIDLFGV